MIGWQPLAYHGRPLAAWCATDCFAKNRQLTQRDSRRGGEFSHTYVVQLYIRRRFMVQSHDDTSLADVRRPTCGSVELAYAHRAWTSFSRSTYLLSVSPTI